MNPTIHPLNFPHYISQCLQLFYVQSGRNPPYIWTSHFKTLINQKHLLTMDPIKIEKIQAINRYKKQQLLNSLFLYSLTALTCSLFFSSPLWYPPLYSCMQVFLFLSLPQISSLFFSSKFFFILGNLIVIFLVGESKMFTSDHSSSISDVYYDEYVNRSKSLQNLSPLDKKQETKSDKSFEEKTRNTSSDGEKKLDVDGNLDGEGFGLPAEELNKRAEDFIARVKNQRRLEASLFICSTE